MSGSSNGGGDWRPAPKMPVREPAQQGGGDDGSGISDTCAIHEKTTLNSVDRTVLATLRVGVVMDVVFDSGPPHRLIAQLNGAFAGSITSPSMLQFIQCIQGGKQYVADVIAIQGGTCQVVVHPR
jgi:hypothetical protein